MDGGALLESVRRSEGRTLMCEVLWSAPPLVDGVSNAQVVAAFGADLVLLNKFEGTDIASLKARLGRPVGVNVEPSDRVPDYRQASRENLGDLRDADFIVITDRKSTRLNSSHANISYAVFCLKKNNN